MDLDKLKAEHNSIYMAAVADGVAQERARVTDHIKVATAAGVVDAAHKAIADGSTLADMTATYLSATISKGQIAASDSDSLDVDDVTVDADKKSSMDESVVAAVEGLMGVSINV